MERKLTLIYSPCQVSNHGNHYQETHPTMDWDMWLASTDVSNPQVHGLGDELITDLFALTERECIR